ncbi:MAG: phage protein Gp36 family protein [Halomonas sp.]
MPYLSVDTFLARYLDADEARQLLGQNADGEVPAQGRETAELAIERAGMELNSRLAPRYPVPVPHPPAELEDAVGALARRRLYTFSPPESVTQEAERVRAYLDEAGQGVRQIHGLSPAATPPAGASGAGLRGRADREMTRETLWSDPWK